MQSPSLRQLVAVVALVALVVGGFLGLYALTPATGRGALLDRAVSVGPGLGTAAVALLTYLGMGKVKAQQAEHGQQLATITEQTNGVLRQKIVDVIEEAFAARGLPRVQPGEHSITTASTPTPAGYPQPDVPEQAPAPLAEVVPLVATAPGQVVTHAGVVAL